MKNEVKIENLYNNTLNKWEEFGFADDWSDETLDDFINEVVVHEKNKKLLSEFIEDGGKFKISDTDDLMNYDEISKEITINSGFFVDNHWAEIGSVLFHELYHHHALKKFNQSDYNKYNEKTVQKFEQIHEIVAYFNMVSTCYEIGGHYWDKVGRFKDNVQTYMQQHNINPGEKIPNEMLVPLGNLVTKCFWKEFESDDKSLSNDYQIDLIEKVTGYIKKDKKNNARNVNISAIELAKKVELPVSFSEPQLEGLLLLNKNIVPDNFKDKVSVSDNINYNEIKKFVEESFKILGSGALNNKNKEHNLKDMKFLHLAKKNITK